MAKNSFDFAHLPPNLAALSAPFRELAKHLIASLPPSAERTAALRKLVEAKDCAVRAAGGIVLPNTLEEFTD